jgi:hypothetical protein
MEGLYKFYWDCGRQGSLEGVFIEDEENIKDIIGKEVYFGEVLGKHSEIYGIIKNQDITLVTKDFPVIKIIKEYSLESGFNPFDYIEEK